MSIARKARRVDSEELRNLGFSEDLVQEAVLREQKELLAIELPAGLVERTIQACADLFSPKKDESELATPEARLRVLIADDHEVVRRGLREILREELACDVVFEAADGREAVEKTREHMPDIVILDVAMPRLDGVEATREILKINPQAKVLILTMNGSKSVVDSIISAGARGFLLKTDAIRELIPAVRAIRNKGMYLSSDRSLWDSVIRAEEPSPLTPREIEILQLLAGGKSTKEVAIALSLSVKTVETHRSNIMRKLKMHSVSDLVLYVSNHHIQDASRSS